MLAKRKRPGEVLAPESIAGFALPVWQKIIKGLLMRTVLVVAAYPVTPAYPFPCLVVLRLHQFVFFPLLSFWHLEMFSASPGM